MQWRIGPFRLDQDHACLWQGDKRVVLRPKTFDLLVYLVEHAGELATKEELLAAIWPETVVADSALTVGVSELRKALGETARAPQFVATVHRRGYRLIAPVTPLDPSALLAPATAPAPTQGEALEASPPVAAERRQLTVLFCDLVDSTRLAVQLDPEDLRDVLQAYHQTCVEMVERFDGYVAQYLGDGVLVYFGYPLAHEDDAQRPVWSGLGLLEAMSALGTRLALPSGYALAVRLGVHTGLVVMSEVGAGARHEPLAQGETPHLAARLQSLAGPNELIISGATRDLLGGMFRLKDLGEQVLRGVAAPMQVYRVEGAQTVESRFEAMTSTGLTPLVGREEELELLWRRWQQATEGEGQVVLLSGEAGLGKSRLTQALCERLGDELHLRVLYQCSPYHTHSAFYPIIAHLERTLQLAQVPLPGAKLDRLETLLAQADMTVAEVAPLFAALLSIPSDDRYAPLRLSPEQQKEQTLAAWAELVVGLSQREPVLIVFEDMHWSDPTTLEALANMVDRGQDARILLMLTFRPEFAPPWHHFAHVTTYTLNRLTRRQVVAMVEQIAGRTELPAELVEQFVTRADGVPLFVEEATKTVLESVGLHEHRAHDALASPAWPRELPVNLWDALMARLDRLPLAVKQVAQMGAVIGREFDYSLLVALCQWRDDMLWEALEALVTTGLLFRRGTLPTATYLFKHALVQDAAYASLLRSTRQQLHTTIAQVLEAHFPQTVEAQPELLAHHYTEAGLTKQAVTYWTQAGSQAVRQSANIEAIAHITQGLALLAQLPETLERAQDELALYVELGVALTVTKGFAAPEVERAYARARALCQQLGNTPQLFPVLYGLWNFYLVRADMHTVFTVAEQIWELAQREDDVAILMEAHNVHGQTQFLRGDLASARGHIEHVLALYDPQQHSGLALEYGEDPGIACSVFAALDMWHLGYPALALQHVASMSALAQELEHPFSTAQVLFFGAATHLFLRDRVEVQVWAKRLMDLCREQDFMFWLAGSLILHGWALAAQGQHAEGIDQIQQGFADWRATGAEIFTPLFLGLLAEAYGYAGQPEVAQSFLVEALTAADEKGECWYKAELHRLRGALLLSHFSDHHVEAEACFYTAIDLARAQQAKSFELRAATSLSRLWQQQGKWAEAYHLLAAIYSWFTEGFDTADLQDAKVLLDELETW